MAAVNPDAHRAMAKYLSNNFCPAHRPPEAKGVAQGRVPSVLCMLERGVGAAFW